MTNTGIITFVSEIDYANFNYFHISINGKYLITGMEPSMMKMYEYDHTTDQYIFTHAFNNFYLGYPSWIYVSENASFVLGNKGGDTTLYFGCDVHYCSTCSSLAQCQVCHATFTLTSDNLCSCSS